MANISSIKLPNGNVYDIKDNSKSTATNWRNGSQIGSLRTSFSAAEDSNYTIGQCAVAEGSSTRANGNYSHAEGIQTTAGGNSSHAEGDGTIASGSRAHAQNFFTIAQRRSQTVIGEYNIADTSGADNTELGAYSFIIGNGTIDARSNALTVDWNGNGVFAGKITVGSAPTANMDVATKKYVDDAIGEITSLSFADIDEVTDGGQ
jgi:hypothetical protein